LHGDVTAMVTQGLDGPICFIHVHEG
jgi:hypothetical protein